MNVEPVASASPIPTSSTFDHAPARPPLSPSWFGGFQDLPREHAFEPLRVTGRLPAGLEGVLYRNGPGRFGVGGERFGHWFDADGAISSVKLEGGRASGAARLVQTAGLLREERAGKRLFGGYGTPFARPFREMFLGDGKQTANTSVLLWQGRLFATGEAGKPYEVARGDLSTLGESTLDGVVTGALSAHPHHVPARRATYNFGLTHVRGRTQVDLYALPDEGRASRLATFQVEGVRLNHDFAVTGRHAVFLVAPHYLSLVNTLVLRRPPVSSAKWRADRGTEVVVVDLDAPSTVRRFRVGAFLAEHVVNAFEEGGEVVIDCTHYDDADGLEGFVGGLAAGRIAAPLRSSLRRLRVDVARESMKVETLLDRPIELPRVAPRVDGVAHRYTYAVAFERPFGELLKIDGQTGRVDGYDPGADRYLGEGVFVPRPGGADEDDGWVLTMVFDARADASRLEILDARAVGDGPLAACHFDHPVPFGFHGAFAAGDARHHHEAK